MSQEKKNIRIQSRIDSKVNWEEKNPTLLDREIGYEEETGRYKFGAIDEMGEEMHWNDLPYASSGGLSPEFDDTSEIFNVQGENSAGQMGYFIRSIDFDNHKIYLSNIQYPLPDVSSVDYTDSEFETPAYEIGDSFNLILKTFENKREHYHFISNIVEIYNNVVIYDTALPFSEIYVETDAEYGQSFFVSKKPNVGTYNLGGFSHAEGQMTYASGGWSHSEGFGGIAAGMFSHVEGREGRAAYAAHAEGYICDALGNHSHAEGNLTQALGNNAHSEGKLTEAQALSSHAEGEETKARSSYSHAEGRYSSTDGEASHAEGQGTNASGNTAHSEGQSTKAQGAASHAEGWGTIATGRGAHSEGGKDNDLKIDSTTASGNYSHAEGLGSVASGMAAHSEGRQTTSSGNFSHAEGLNSIASAPYSHAENKATASGEGSHAEASSTASGVYGHAEGNATTSSGKGAHSEGRETQAKGDASHAEGYQTETKASYSHAEGRGTIASCNYQHVQGRYNIEDTSATTQNPQGTYAHIVGNGTGTTKRKNIYTLDWDGNGWFAGDVYVNSNYKLPDYDTRLTDNTFDFIAKGPFKTVGYVGRVRGYFEVAGGMELITFIYNREDNNSYHLRDILPDQFFVNIELDGNLCTEQQYDDFYAAKLVRCDNCDFRFLNTSYLNDEGASKLHNLPLIIDIFSTDISNPSWESNNNRPVEPYQTTVYYSMGPDTDNKSIALPSSGYSNLIILDDMENVVCRIDLKSNPSSSVSRFLTTNYIDFEEILSDSYDVYLVEYAYNSTSFNFILGYVQGETFNEPLGRSQRLLFKFS